MFPIEWDLTALTRKYLHSVCWVNHNEETFLALVMAFTPNTADNGLSTAPLIDYMRVTEKGTYSSTVRGYVATETFGIPVRNLTRVQLKPYSVKPKILSGKDLRNVFIFHRRRTKQYLAGVGQQFATRAIHAETVEKVDLAFVLSNTVKPHQKVVVIDPVLHAYDGNIYAYNSPIGFLNDGVARIESPALRKLVAERAKQWQVQVL
jgi:hypothetical protein